eukprot:10801990-Ditylum_brightwellii.AAC.1
MSLAESPAAHQDDTSEASSSAQASQKSTYKKQSYNRQLVKALDIPYQTLRKKIKVASKKRQDIKEK